MTFERNSNPQLSMPGQFPRLRLRRNRRENWTRRLVAEHSLSIRDLIWPVFVHEKPQDEPIASMPGICRFSVASLLESVKEAAALGIPAIALFPVVDTALKSQNGEEAINPDNLICRTIRAIKALKLDIGIICDVALDPYTTHGQDGLVVNGYVENDLTIEMLCKQSLVQARAGCDVIAPSDMMDGRVGLIRDALDAEGFSHVSILSYGAKYASSFYGPFRDAVGSAANLGTGDKRTYQMDPANGNEALREVALDISEGADMIMVKPGMPYLDVLHTVASRFPVPVFAYQVSGEYAMLKAAAANGWMDWDKTIMESLIAFKRAGADGIFTYAALEMARKLAAK
jgi:porphobilinogen synthase